MNRGRGKCLRNQSFRISQLTNKSTPTVTDTSHGLHMPEPQDDFDTLVTSSLAVLLENKTTRSSAVPTLHLSQRFTPLLKFIPASFVPHAPCPPSLILSLPTILTPVLRMCHLFEGTYATLGACLSTPIWWGNFLWRGKPLKGGQTLGA